MDFWVRLLLCCLMMGVAIYGAFSNKARDREPGKSLYAFLLESENFNDWGKLWRVVALVSLLAMAGVVTMKGVATLFGGPLLDLDQFK
jgi:hypothetical protein